MMNKKLAGALMLAVAIVAPKASAQEKSPLKLVKTVTLTSACMTSQIPIKSNWSEKCRVPPGPRPAFYCETCTSWCLQPRPATLAMSQRY